MHSRDNMERRYAIAEMAADALRKGQRGEYRALRSAVYSLFLHDGWTSADVMTDDLIGSYNARCDIL